MIKYMIKRKVKNELVENRKKVALYTGLAAASATGIYISYKLIKKIKDKNEDDFNYLEYDEDEEFRQFEKELDKQELKEKVDEFNSRRICSENCDDSSPEEMTKYIDSIEDDKKNIKIDEDEYKDDKYEEYEEDVEK